MALLSIFPPKSRELWESVRGEKFIIGKRAAWRWPENVAACDYYRCPFKVMKFVVHSRYFRRACRYEAAVSRLKQRATVSKLRCLSALIKARFNVARELKIKFEWKPRVTFEATGLPLWLAFKNANKTGCLQVQKPGRINFASPASGMQGKTRRFWIMKAANNSEEEART